MATSKKVVPVLDPTKALEGLRRLYKEATAQGIQPDPQVQALGVFLKKMVEGSATKISEDALTTAPLDATAAAEVWKALGSTQGLKTVTEAQQYLVQNCTRSKGVPCPCCGSYVKVYRRTLNDGMVYNLIWLVRYLEENEDSLDDGWIHIPSLAGEAVLRSREEGKLVYWGLLERRLWENGNGYRAGWWRVTPVGLDFVHERVQVPEFVLIYKNRLLSHSPQKVSVRDVLKKKKKPTYDYDTLMATPLAEW